MKLFLTLLLMILSATGGVFGTRYWINRYTEGIDPARTLLMQESASAFVALTERLADSHKRLTLFSEAVATDRTFSLKLMVENDTTAPEITEFAPRYAPAMGFDLLTIADENGRLFSETTSPNLSGDSALLTTRADKKFRLHFTIADSTPIIVCKIPFTCQATPLTTMGGFIINNHFARSLSHSPTIQAIIRCDDRYYGMENLKTISEPTPEGTIYLNNEPWLVEIIPPPFETNATNIALYLVTKPTIPAHQ